MANAGAVAVVQSGQALTSAGALVTTKAPGGLVPGAGGVNFDKASQALYVVDKALATAPTRVVNGLTLDANGALVCVAQASATAPVIPLSGVNLDASGALLATGY